jgi:RNA polymerase sigma-70 factor (ECF subfamily)
MAAVSDDAVAQLIRAVAVQDRAAFRALYLATRDALFGVLMRMLRNRASAEDGLQEVYARIWLRAGSYVESRGSGMTWLTTIARNYAIDQRRQRHFTEMDALEVDDLVDPRRGADDYLVAQGVVERIVMCLGRLEPRHADCIKRAYLDGVSYVDLANRHTVPVNTMRTWLRRGLLKLRDCVLE